VTALAAGTRTLAALALGAALLFGASEAGAIVTGRPVHGLALYGEPKYGADFTHFDYVNPNAPKGGSFSKTNEAYLTFDTFNPYTVKGASAHGLELLLFDTLMTPSQDEPASVYGLIAETAEVAPDNSWVQFVIRPGAKFTDGSPITADDVVFSYDTLIKDAVPHYRAMYADVANTEIRDARTIRFIFKTTENRKLPFLLAKFLPVLSKAWWSGRDFTATVLEIPVTNGPYRIDSFEVGKYIVYRRDENYWGKDLPVNRGLNNFDQVRFEYFLDDDVEFEAFKTNGHDFVRETTARRWATGYDFPAMQNGRVKKMEVRDILPTNVQPVYFNLRRPLFQDRRVRQALAYAFDFESLNANLFYGQYERTRSYWQGSPLEAKGLPDEAERKLLEPFRDRVPAEVFTAEFTQPTTKGDGNLRDSLLKARELLEAAGWILKDGVLVDAKTEQPFTFEFLIRQQSIQRVFLPYLQNLERLGIRASLRMVDTSQYINRLNDFDYDATNLVFPRNDLAPGPEQRDIWGSQVADVSGANNLSGVKDPVVDALIDKIVAAQTYEDVTAATKALDRVLTWNFYQLLTYSAPVERYAYWTTKLAAPEKTPPLGLGNMGEFSDGLGETAIVLWWSAAAATATTPEVPSTPPSSGVSRALIITICAIGVILLFVFIRSRRKA